MSDDDLNRVIADVAAEVEITLRVFHERTVALSKTAEELAELIRSIEEQDDRT